MGSLQTLVESILGDLIQARFEADTRAADLAEYYRGHPALGSMSVPTLNISNVEVELRLAFDNTPLEAPSKPTPEQTQAIEEAASALGRAVTELPSVKQKLGTDAERKALQAVVVERSVAIASERVLALRPALRDALERELGNALGTRGVVLTAADRDLLAQALVASDAKITAVPRPATKVPGVIVGAQALSGLDAGRISTVRFQIDLDEARWTELDDGTGSSTAVLTK